MPILRPVPFNKGAGLLKTILTYTREWDIWEDYLLDIPGHPTLVVPAGFRLDLASVPKLCRGLLSPSGVLLIPGLIHDYGYRYDCLVCKQNGRLEYYMNGAGKDAFDLLFLEIANEVNGLTKINNIAYKAVKYGGGKAWKNNRKLNL